MKTRRLHAVVILLVGCLVAGTLWAQRPPFRGPQGGNQGGGNNGGNNNGGGNNRPREVKLPDDPRLLEFHKTFVETADKLASEYEAANQLDKAQACYEEILRLVPSYTEAQTKLDALKGKQAGKEKKVFTVMANEDWQNTGVMLIQGKPVIITADGEWKFHIAYDLGPDGIDIPKDLQEFNPGALIGVIGTGNAKDAKPFLVGARKEFTADKTGPLFLRIYDSDVSDNTGKLNVTITGTFNYKK